MTIPTITTATVEMAERNLRMALNIDSYGDAVVNAIKVTDAQGRAFGVQSNTVGYLTGGSAGLRNHLLAPIASYGGTAGTITVASGALRSSDTDSWMVAIANGACTFRGNWRGPVNPVRMVEAARAARVYP